MIYKFTNEKRRRKKSYVDWKTAAVRVHSVWSATFWHSKRFHSIHVSVCTKPQSPNAHSNQREKRETCRHRKSNTRSERKKMRRKFIAFGLLFRQLSYHRIFMVSHNHITPSKDSPNDTEVKPKNQRRNRGCALRDVRTMCPAVPHTSCHSISAFC